MSAEAVETNAARRWVRETLGPLSRRELTYLGRSRGWFYTRSLILALGTVFGLLALPTLSFQSQLAGEALNPGLAFFDTLLGVVVAMPFIGAVLALFYAPIAVLREREEETLGMLLLAGFSPRDFFWSKLLIIYLCVASLQLLAFPLMVFGETIGMGTLRNGVGNLLVAQCGILTGIAYALLLGTFVRNTGEAMIGVVLFLAAAFPGLTILSDAIPGFSFIRYLNPLNGMPGNGFLVALVPYVVTAGHLAFAAWLAERRVPALAYRPVIVARGAGRKARQVTESNAMALHLRGTSVGITAMAGHPYIGWGLMVLSFAAIPFMGLGHILLSCLMVYEMSACLIQSRDKGMLAEVMVTPMDERAFSKGLYRGLLRRAWVYWPAIVLSILWIKGFMALPMSGAIANTEQSVAVWIQVAISTAGGTVSSLCAVLVFAFATVNRSVAAKNPFTAMAGALVPLIGLFILRGFMSFAGSAIDMAASVTSGSAPPPVFGGIWASVFAAATSVFVVWGTIDKDLYGKVRNHRMGGTESR